MDALFVPLSNAVGASLDQTKLITCLLVSYPLGSVFVRIPSDKHALKHLFNIAVSLFFLIPVLHLRNGFLQLLVSTLGTYAIAALVKGPNMPWIIFAFVMGHLTINHMIRAIYNIGYETFEVTGPQMVLTMKLTTFAWNVYDGRRPTGELDKWQLSKRITELPSLLEFLGYAFYFPGILVGPYLEYADYKSLIDETLFKNIKRQGKDATQHRTVPSGRKRVAYRKLAVGLTWLGAFVLLGGKFSYSTSVQPWYLSKGLLYRILYLQISGTFERAKYYAIWTLTEGAAILTGLGFTGYSPKGDTLWDGAANVRMLDIECPENFKGIFDSWNMKTNVWLRECVYKRVTPPGKKPGARSSTITFATSAFWHGIAGGYYLAFVTAAGVSELAKLCRRNIRPLVLPPPGSRPTVAKQAYDIAGTILSITLLNYCASPFMLLTVKDSLTCWHRLAWYGHITLILGLTFFHAGGRGYLQGLQRKVGVAPPKGKPVANGKTSQDEEEDLSPDVHMIPPLAEVAREVERQIELQQEHDRQKSKTR